MSDISTIRTLIADPLLFQTEDIEVDGAHDTIQVKYFPVVDGTVIITGTDEDWTLDEENGVVTFANAPDAGTLIVKYKHVFLLDAAIQEMLDLNADATDNVRLAAADCLDIIARNQVLVQKKIKLLDLETDGPAVARELRASAKAIRDLVFDPNMTEADFEIVEQINTKADWEEKITKETMREGG